MSTTITKDYITDRKQKKEEYGQQTEPVTPFNFDIKDIEVAADILFKHHKLQLWTWLIKLGHLPFTKMKLPVLQVKIPKHL